MQSDQGKSAVILMNLGTPERPDARSVGQFLTEFLSDSRVVEAPRWFWLPLLKLVVVPSRSRRVARLYQKIWTESGSPIRAITEQQVSALQSSLNETLGMDAPQVVHAMTYGKPGLGETVRELKGQGYEHIVLLPLYPQYSGSTTGAIYDQVADLYRESRDVPELHVVKHYYQLPSYIDALALSVERHWQKYGRNERLLLSFHGVPKEYVDAGDPYYQQCLATAEALASRLKLNESQWGFSFQSRFGPKEWVKPYTDDLLEKWISSGIKSVDVISPSFSSDCLETLEELNQEVRELFLEKGGDKYSFIPCLNDDQAHISMMKEIVKSRLKF